MASKRLHTEIFINKNNEYFNHALVKLLRGDNMKLSETIEKITKALQTPEEKPRLNRREVKTDNMESCSLLPTCPGNTVNVLLYSGLD